MCKRKYFGLGGGSEQGLDTLPSDYKSRVMALEVDEKPTEHYNDIGGLEKQVICFAQ
jgi:26S proteasome regulatory subunit T5